MKALVVGYGSIGQRHARILQELGIEVSVVSRRGLELPNCYTSVESAFQINEFNYVIIANETSSHIEVLRQLVKHCFRGCILVEKPLFMREEFIDFDYSKIFVAYNLRFHPLMQKLREHLKGETVISVNAYVGQYLPSWRPNSDYTKSYSAIRQQGGGVLRDLSHELDYLMNLFGDWASLVSKVDKISDLNIQSEDYVHVSYISKKNVYVTAELNYLDRITQRYVTVQTNNKTVKIDFINNKINVNGEIEHLPLINRDYTYIKQHEAVLKNPSLCCTFGEGMKVVKMIRAVEKSSLLKEWVNNV